MNGSAVSTQRPERENCGPRRDGRCREEDARVAHSHGMVLTSPGIMMVSDSLLRATSHPRGTTTLSDHLAPSGGAEDLRAADSCFLSTRTTVSSHLCPALCGCWPRLCLPGCVPLGLPARGTPAGLSQWGSRQEVSE